MSRIDRARRNVTIARYAIGITAAAALAAFAAVARAAHPATHATRVTTTRSTATSSSSDDSYFGQGASSDSYSDIGPSGSASPQVQSGAS